ncbi:MAG: hypothetical protein LBL65_05115 [Campylobacteraceae bacterium]|nr:hypothetical protein [Campylobacteraceae bacterium]
MLELFAFDLEYSVSYNHRHSKEVREIIRLLSYAPQSVVVHIKDQFLKYKKLHNETPKPF